MIRELRRTFAPHQPGAQIIVGQWRNGVLGSVQIVKRHDRNVIGHPQSGFGQAEMDTKRQHIRHAQTGRYTRNPLQDFGNRAFTTLDRQVGFHAVRCKQIDLDGQHPRPSRGTAQAYELKSGEVVKIIGLEGQNCSDLMAMRSSALGAAL